MLVRDSFFRARFRSAFVHFSETGDGFEMFCALVEFRLSRNPGLKSEEF